MHSDTKQKNTDIIHTAWVCVLPILRTVSELLQQYRKPLWCDGIPRIWSHSLYRLMAERTWTPGTILLTPKHIWSKSKSDKFTLMHSYVFWRSTLGVYWNGYALAWHDQLHVRKVKSFKRYCKLSLNLLLVGIAPLLSPQVAQQPLWLCKDSFWDVSPLFV